MSRWVEDVDDLAALVSDGDCIGPSGFHFVRAPVAQIRALCRRGVRDLVYVAWGGGLPLELLLSAGAVRKVIFCFSSFDIFGLAPRFRRAMERAEIEAEEWPALGLIKALKAGSEQLEYQTFQTPAGSDLWKSVARPAPHLFDERATPMAAAHPVACDAFLLHASRADEAGNVEITGARGFDLSTLFGAKRLLVTVEERVPTGTLRSGTHSFVVPRTFVTALAVAPFGAWPTSCLPRYGADYRSLQGMAALDADTPLDTTGLEPTGERRDQLQALASLAPERITSAVRGATDEHASAGPTAEAPWTIDELMAVCLARELDNNSICSVGSVSPLATVAYLLAKQLWAPELLLITSNGGYIDVPSRPMTILMSEILDFATAATHLGGDDTYHWYYQRGLITHEVVSAAQIDRHARTNNVLIHREDRGLVRLPGQGGMADVANMHRDFGLYLTRHSPKTTVEEVAFVSAMRRYHRAEVRRAYGYQPGRTTLLTNLGRFELDPDCEQLVLTELHPGVSLDELRQQTGFEVLTSPALSETIPPTPEELTAIRRDVDPLGIRRLEFVPGVERAGLIDELFTCEEALIQRQFTAQRS